MAFTEEELARIAEHRPENVCPPPLLSRTCHDLCPAAQGPVVVICGGCAVRRVVVMCSGGGGGQVIKTTLNLATTACELLDEALAMTDQVPSPPPKKPLSPHRT